MFIYFSGLSYKKGLIHFDMLEQHKEMLLSPIDISVTNPSTKSLPL